MKIVAGLGSIDEYIKFAEAGADEFFCGYVPYSWSQKYGTVLPLNRREVLCYNVQLGAFSELEILSGMMKKYEKPVHLTFNSLYYIPEQYPEIAGIISQCMKIGFHSYIIADPALIVYLRENGINCEIHLSGECGEINSQMVASLAKMRLKRVIFHRKNTFEDMKAVVDKCGKKDGTDAANVEMLKDMDTADDYSSVRERCESGIERIPEFEAFVLNEMCQFTGAFCNSLHCDEMGYLCKVPYQIGTLKTGNAGPEIFNQAINGVCLLSDDFVPDDFHSLHDFSYDSAGYLCGETGCGLCALYQLKQTGITHLKLVGRGNYTDYMEKDIRNLRMALNILRESVDEMEFRRKLKLRIFPRGCSRNCYYR